MNATFLDFRRKSSQIAQALRRKEEVRLFYRGELIAVVQPVSTKPSTMRMEDHPAIGMWADREDMRDVDAYVRRIRKGRFHDR